MVAGFLGEVAVAKDFRPQSGHGTAINVGDA